jgi:hypothetical protein
MTDCIHDWKTIGTLSGGMFEPKRELKQCKLCKDIVIEEVKEKSMFGGN